MKLKKREKIKAEVAIYVEESHDNFRKNVIRKYPKINFHFPPINEVMKGFDNILYPGSNSLSKNVLNVYDELLIKLGNDFLTHKVEFSGHKDIVRSLADDSFWRNEKKNQVTKNGRNPYDWKIRRLIVFHRDSATCQRCGCEIELDKCHVHHIKRRSEGGNHSFLNLVALCRDCHTIMEGHENMRAYRTYFISSTKTIHRYGCRFTRNAYPIVNTYPALRSKGYKSCSKCKPWETHERALKRWRPNLLRIPTNELVNSW